MSETQQFDFEIEDDIPMPEGRDTLTAKYPYDRLEVGQSFFVPQKESKNMSASTRYWRSKYPDRDWRVKKAEHNGVEGVRIWRNK